MAASPKAGAQHGGNDLVVSDDDKSGRPSLPRVSLCYDESQFSADRFIPATLTFEDSVQHVASSCLVRRRGATSLIYDKPNFAIKFVDDAGESIDLSLAGMRKDNYWILDGMASDHSKMRNRVSMDLWLDFSRPPYHQDAEPKAINGYRGSYVEVYVNDAYFGLFCLMERLDRKQLKLKKYKESQSSVDDDGATVDHPAYYRGLLYKAVNGYSTRTPYLLYQGNDPNDLSSSYDGMQAEYPNVSDGEPWSWQPLRDNIYFLAAKVGNVFNLNIDKYFDVPVFVDYVLFLDLLYANDNVGKNVFYWFYDQTSDDQRVGVTPWDLDTSWGRNYMGSPVDASLDLSNKSNFHTRFQKYYAGYADTLSTRYAELRTTYWAEDSLIARFDHYFSLLQSTGAWQRELSRWKDSNCKTQKLADEQRFIHQWIPLRLAHLDEVYGFDPTAQDLPAIVSPGDAASAAYYDVYGRRQSRPRRGQLLIRPSYGIVIVRD